jgi:hypothetical protein
MGGEIAQMAGRGKPAGLSLLNKCGTIKTKFDRIAPLLRGQ